MLNKEVYQIVLAIRPVRSADRWPVEDKDEGDEGGEGGRGSTSENEILIRSKKGKPDRVQIIEGQATFLGDA